MDAFMNWCYTHGTAGFFAWLVVALALIPLLALLYPFDAEVRRLVLRAPRTIAENWRARHDLH